MAQKSFKILVTEPIPDNVISYLEKHADVYIGKKGEFQKESNLKVNMKINIRRNIVS